MLLAKFIQVISWDTLFKLHLNNYTYWKILCEKYPCIEKYNKNENLKNIAYVLSIIDAWNYENFALISRIIKEYPDNYCIALNCVYIKSRFFQFVSERLRSNKMLIMTAINSRVYESSIWLILNNITDKSFYNDYQIIHFAVSKEGSCIRYASDELKKNKKLALIAVNQNGNALQYLTEEFRNDIDIVMAAVKRCGTSIKYALDITKNNIDICEASIENDGYAIRYFNDIMKNNFKLVRKAVKKDPHVLYFVSDELKDNETIAYEAVIRNGMCLEYVSDRIKNNDIIVLSAVNNYGLALEFASKRIRNKKYIVEAAAKNDINALFYASKDLKRILSPEGIIV